MSSDLDLLPQNYWHCRVSLEGKKGYAVVNDMPLEDLKRNIIAPWHAKAPFSVSGTIVKSRNDVSTIQLVQTDAPKAHYASEHEARSRSNGIVDMATDRRLLPFGKGKDYTQDILFSTEAFLTETESSHDKAVSGTKVFVVHGHDDGAKLGVARFLENIGYEPIILHEQVSRGRTVIEKIEQNSDVSFAVVLLTPDDVGKAADGADFEKRARQNVLIELGYFIGKLGRDRVCALRKGDAAIPSDFAGVVWTDFDAANAWKVVLARELEASGHQIDWKAVGRS